MFSITLTGASTVARNMWLTHAEMGERFERGLERAGKYVIEVTEQFVPIETGALRASAMTKNIGGTGWKADQVVGYGNSEAPYAGYVHERLDLYHKPPTRAKFLEHTLRAYQAQIVMTVYKHMITGR